MKFKLDNNYRRIDNNNKKILNIIWKAKYKIFLYLISPETKDFEKISRYLIPKEEGKQSDGVSKMKNITSTKSIGNFHRCQQLYS